VDGNVLIVDRVFVFCCVLLDIGGHEDEEFRNRINNEVRRSLRGESKVSNFTRTRPPRRNETGSEFDTFFFHFHGDETKRDKRSTHRDPPHTQQSGYHDLEFLCTRMYVLDEAELNYKDLIIVDVELQCNRSRSPNCDEEYVKFRAQQELAEKEAKQKRKEKVE